jgi:putative endonuclease
MRNDGKRFEDAAASWLLHRGLSVLVRNFAARTGEIDIIALDQGCLVFLEVRSRGHPDFGGAAASVDRRKQRRLERTARIFLQSNPQWANLPCRFDVIAYEPSQSASDSPSHWIRGAFAAQPW